MDEVWHEGGCHCGAVRFRVKEKELLTVVKCNCSICVMKQNHHFIVPEHNFQLLSGEDMLTTYTFNTGAAKHTFCKRCGVQSFYTPRSHPHGRGVMPHCITSKTIKAIVYETFDGDNWEQEIKRGTLSAKF